MADKSTDLATSDSVEESLLRLSRKPGVKAWIMLDRSNGAVLKTNGQVSAVRSPKSADNNASLPTPTGASFSSDMSANTNNETHAAQELASMVWSFMSMAGSLVEEVDSEDELKLLRLRTKKQELVIVPEARYLLVVIHDTPTA